MLVTLPAVFVFALKMEQHVVDIALRRRDMGSPHTSTATVHDKYGRRMTHSNEGVLAPPPCARHSAPRGGPLSPSRRPPPATRHPPPDPDPDPALTPP